MIIGKGLCPPVTCCVPKDRKGLRDVFWGEEEESVNVRAKKWDHKGTCKEVTESYALGSDHSRNSVNASHWVGGWIWASS